MPCRIRAKVSSGTGNFTYIPQPQPAVKAPSTSSISSSQPAYPVSHDHKDHVDDVNASSPVHDTIVVNTLMRTSSSHSPDLDNLGPESALPEPESNSRPSSEPVLADDSEGNGSRQSAPEITQDGIVVSAERRNPKRKASNMANLDVPEPDEILERSMIPLSNDEIEDWQGWIELESEPAFFTSILQNWGVKDVKVQEIFSIDPDSFSLLPKPTHGLIFLFQYVSDGPSIENEPQEDDSQGVWFANQTVDNACATVALMNIVMNSQGVDLGDNLRKFKDATQNLTTPLRGHQLSLNTFIRSVHNSFSRRMDQLNADLYLSNEADDYAIRSKKRGYRKKSNKKQKTNSDSGYHFIAYVPSGGSVWELDGLKADPVCLGHIEPSNGWTDLAIPRINARIMQYEDDQYSFNLLALCQSPLIASRTILAETSKALTILSNKMASDPAWHNLTAHEPVPLPYSLDRAPHNDADTKPHQNGIINKNDVKDIDPSLYSDNASAPDEPNNPNDELSRYGLSRDIIDNTQLPPDLCKSLGIEHRNDDNDERSSSEEQVTTAKPSLSLKEATDLFQELLVRQRSARGEYIAELNTAAEDEERVRGRRRDYTPALHAWLRLLAERDVLEELIQEV